MQRENNLNTVLQQELGRFNVFLALIVETLTKIRKALRGEELLSEQLENVSEQIS